MDKAKELSFEWYWCETCNTAAIQCPVCGNNCCNAMYGTLPDGQQCPYCVLAYEYQDLGWKTSTDPKTPDECVGVWPKFQLGEEEAR